MKISKFLVFLCLSISACAPQQAAPTLEAEHNTTVWLLSQYGESESEVASELKERLLSRLVGGTKVVSPDFSKPIRLFFLHTATPSAFSQCNGSIFLTEGMITSVGTLAELSAIIAHEIGHVVREDACNAKADSEGNISYSHGVEVETDKLASKILLASFIDPRYLSSAIQTQYRLFSGSDAEKSLVNKRLDILQEAFQKIPAVKTKFAEERLFNKLRGISR